MKDSFDFIVLMQDLDERTGLELQACLYYGKHVFIVVDNKIYNQLNCNSVVFDKEKKYKVFKIILGGYTDDALTEILQEKQAILVRYLKKHDKQKYSLFTIKNNSLSCVLYNEHLVDINSRAYKVFLDGDFVNYDEFVHAMNNLCKRN